MTDLDLESKGTLMISKLNYTGNMLQPPESEVFIQEGLRAFSQALHTSLPLTHFRDYHDEAKIKEIADVESDKCLKVFEDKILIYKNKLKKGDLKEKFLSEIGKLTEQYLIKNRDFGEIAEAILKKQVVNLLENFKKISEAHLLLNADIDEELLQGILESGKLSALRKFECYSNFGNPSLYEVQKKSLWEKLNYLSNELLVKPRKSILANKSIKVKNTVLEMSKELKSNVLSANVTVPKEELLEKVMAIHNYLMEDGSILTLKYGELYASLLETLEVATAFLDSDEIIFIPVEDAIGFAEELELELQFDFENEMELSGMPEQEQVACTEPELTLGTTKGQEQDEHEDLDLETQDDSFNLATFLGIDDDTFTIGNCKESPLKSFQESDVGGGGKCTADDELTIEAPLEDRVASECVRKQSEKLIVDNEFTTRNCNGTALQGRVQVESDSVRKRSYREVLLSGGISNASVVVSDANAGSPKRQKISKENRTPNLVVDSSTEVGTSSEDASPAKRQIIQNWKTEEKPSARRSKRLLKTPAWRNDVKVPPKKKEFSPILCAIYKGQSLEYLEKMLNDGADPNAKSRDKVKSNAAHEVIASIIDKNMSTDKALDILNLLVANGFNLVNEGNRKGVTPLHLAMQIKDLDERLLTWFHRNNADFNAKIIAKESSQDSVLLHAVALGQGPGILQKLLEFGADQDYVNIWKQNAIDRSLMSGNQTAFEFFIDKLDVNARNIKNATALHLIFKTNHLDHEKCLRMLLERGADFFAEYCKGYVPLIEWIMDAAKGFANPFPTLVKVKDILPITQEVASATLTIIVEAMGCIRKLWPEEPQNEFSQFFKFLVQEKHAKLRLRMITQSEWKEEEEEWRELENVFMAPNLTEELERSTAGRRKGLSGEEVVGRVKSAILERLGLQKKSRNLICVETVMVSLLTCAEYGGFVELCEFLEVFCKSVGSE